MRKRPIGCLLLALCLPLLAACSEKAPPPPAQAPPGKTLLVGLIPEQNIFKQMERYEPLAEYLYRKTGTKINLKILPRYGNIIDNFKSSGLDGAFFGSFTYMLAHAKIGVEVLVRPVALDNTSTYYGLIFVRKDSGIRTVLDMKGKRFAFVDKATTAGYLLPLEYFHKNGVMDFKGFLKEGYFAGTHEDAIYDVLNRKAEIGAAKNTVFQRFAKNDPRILKELVVLERSPEVPENALALRKDIDPSLRSQLGDALLKMHLDPAGRKVLEQFGALRFVETTNQDYSVVRKYAEDIHLNLSTYDYKND
jgi:phosphonate transport system substrate-binding protein